MITQEFARQFAREWIDAWNAHDLDRILAHYSDEFEMSSPMIARIAGEPCGCLRGKASVREYWSKALHLIPDLQFELIAVFAGVRTIAIHYRGAKGVLALEVFQLSPDSLVEKAFAHYQG